jgi:putative oligomerization/nucleic acid binding protein
MFARRRPLLRAAVVGGAGYVAGKKKAQRQEADSGYGHGGGQPAPGQPAPGQPAPAQPAPAQAPVPAQAAPAEPAEPSVSDQLAQLSNLHAQGALSDAEFATAKTKLLGS